LIRLIEGKGVIVRLAVVIVVFAVGATAWAQQYEAGILAGGSFARDDAIRGAPAAVSAGFGRGAAAGMVVGQNRYARWSGEIRYLFEQADPRIASDNLAASFAGQAHAVQYDIVFRARPLRQRVQPYVAAGGGIKIFRGTGAEAAYRPLMQYAYLTRASEWKPMVAAGGGLKIGVSARCLVRIEVQSQITRFPQKIVAPAPGMALSGWLLDIVPTVGFSWTF
jgi:hypothetical protein